MLKNRNIAIGLSLAVIAFACIASGCQTTSPGTKPASTRTAASAINQKIDEGKINVQGDVDTAPLP